MLSLQLSTTRAPGFTALALIRLPGLCTECPKVLLARREYAPKLDPAMLILLVHFTARLMLAELKCKTSTLMIQVLGMSSCNCDWQRQNEQFQDSPNRNKL